MPSYGRKKHSFSFAATGTSYVDWDIDFVNWLFHSWVVQVPTFSGDTTSNSGCSGINISIIDEDGYVLYTSTEYPSAGTVVVTGMDSLMGAGREITIRAQLAGGSTIVEVPHPEANADVILVLYIW